MMRVGTWVYAALLYLLLPLNLDGVPFMSSSKEAMLNGEVELIVQDALVNCGDEITINILVNNFTDIFGVQFSLQFDSDALTFVSYDNEIGVGLMNINSTNAGNGQLLLSWSHFTGVTLSDGSAIVSLTFLYDGDCSAPTAIEITDSPLFIEISTLAGPLPYNLQMGIIGSLACNADADAGSDQTLCFPGGATTLEGNISGPFTEFSWSPEAGLDDPNSLTPTADVSSDMEYTLTVQSVSDNLIYNPGFELGNVGFTSDYSFETIGLINDGTYTVITSPALISGLFPPCVDHTSGTGNMMVVNGGTMAGENVWCQQISIQPNTVYLFQAFVSTVTPIAPAELQFYVNGDPVGDIQGPTNTSCDWVEISAEWNSGPNTLIELCIVNQNTISPGNDFALDDIGVYQTCEVSDVVQIDVLPELTGSLDSTICQGEAVIVGNTTYDQSGTFEEILSGTAGCDSTVTINLEVISVEAAIFQPDPINCSAPSVFIDGSNSSEGNNITYEWTTNDGNIVSGQGTPIIEVDAAGTYELNVIYDDGSIVCQSGPALIEVIGQNTVPSAEVLEVPFFSCTEGDVSIITSPTYPGIVPTWTTADGEIISGGDSFEPLIGQPGTYELILVDPISQCDSTITVEVEGDQSTPVAIIDGQKVFECGQMMITLRSDGSSTGPDFVNTWWTDDGMILGNTSGSMLVITAPGTYYLEVENTVNQCVDTASFEVLNNPEISLTTALSQDTLTCLQTTSVLTAEIGGAPTDYNFHWITNDGSISTAVDSQVIVVDGQGTYIVFVETSNGECSATDSVTVFENTDIPIADAGPDLTLDCTADSFEVRPGMEVDSSLSYKWEAIDGFILSGTDSASIFINSAGDYILSVADPLNGCESSDTMTAFADSDVPVVIIDYGDTVFNCATSLILLDGRNSSQGSDLIFHWETAGGSFTGSADSTVIQANLEGVYTLTVRDTATGCKSASQIELTGNYDSPFADAGPDQTLTCGNPTAILDGSNSTGQSMEYFWSTTDGLIESDVIQPIINVSTSGTYVLEVTNTETFCSDTDTVLVGQSGVIPQITFEMSDTLTCRNLSVQVRTDISDPSGELNYQWTTSNGNILAGVDSEEIIVDRPGSYRLEVINRITGCTDIDSIEVFQNIEVPAMNVLKSGDLTCDSVESFLSVQITNNLINVDYFWSSTGGNILGDPQRPNVVVNEAGTYYILVTNDENGCSMLDSVSVLQNSSPPSAEAGEDMTLGCSSGDVFLDGSASSGQGMLNYNWSTSNGMIVGSEDEASVQISGAGVYVLSVVDMENGCTAADSVIVVSSVKPELFYSVLQPGCNEAFGILIIDSIFAGNSNPIITLDGNVLDPSVERQLEPGIYELLISDGNDCTSSYVFDILEGEFLSVELPPVYNVLEGDALTLEPVLNQSINEVDSIIWTGIGPELDCYDCLQPNLIASSDGGYTILVISENGCTASTQTSVRIIEIPGENSVFVPNAFSPNGDGVNDRFQPYAGNENIFIKRFEIYNRWGDRVHQRTSLPISDDVLGWDGTWNSKQLNPDEFVYFIEYRDPAGAVKIVKGSVLLMR